jgi:hypothetical protein
MKRMNTMAADDANDCSLAEMQHIMLEPDWLTPDCLSISVSFGLPPPVSHTCCCLLLRNAYCLAACQLPLAAGLLALPVGFVLF